MNQYFKTKSQNAPHLLTPQTVYMIAINNGSNTVAQLQMYIHRCAQ